MTTTLTIGDRLDGRWEIFQIIEGGSAVVYIVYDHEHRTAYAAKTFHHDQHADPASVAAEFVKEALTWINLDAHENVARAEFIQTIQGRPFLFLEYVSGGDLSRWIGTPRLSDDLSQVLRFAIQICDGMIHAAAKGIKVHRDIKPRNCLITEDRTLKVSDFGLAKAFDDKSSGARKKQRPARQVERREVSETRTGAEAGTCTHMAPEQFEDVKQVDVRADIYSFGVVLFQMLTGKLPFDGDTWEDLKRQHQTQTPPALPGSLPPRLTDTVHTCLSKYPPARFADFNSLRRELAAIYAELVGAQAPRPVVGAALDAAAWSNKGVSLSHLRRHGEALACYQHALGLDPQLKEVWNNQGQLLRVLERHSEALGCYERALTIDPGFALAWNNRGLTLESMGRHAEAQGCYEQALGIDPRLKDSWSGKGRVLRALGRHPQALVCFDRALALDPGNAQVWSQRARSLQAVGSHLEALACYRQAFTLDPELVSGKFTRWAARALLSCQRLLTDSAGPAEPKRSRQPQW